MPNYRIVFLKNEVISCVETDKLLLQTGVNLFYEERNGQMIFALVKAKSKEEAENIVKQLISESAVRNKLTVPPSKIE